MKRGGPLRRRTPIRATSLRRRSSAMPPIRKAPRRRPKTRTEREAWQAAREAIYHRATGACERCGTGFEHTGMEAHHRKLRSRGGTDQLANLTALCPACHRWAHDHPAEATAGGWMIPATTDPATIPVTLHSGRTVRLDNDGGYTEGCAA